VVPDEADPTLVVAPTGDETVLVIEDEGLVRSLMTKVLAAHGYRVIVAADGQAGIDAFFEHSAEVQLIVADAVMPRRSGREVYETVRAFRQDTKVLFVTGHAGEVDGPLEPGTAVLTKPISPVELLVTVRRLLG